MKIEIRKCKINEMEEWFAICANNFNTDNLSIFQIPYYREQKSGENQIMVVLCDHIIIGGFRLVKRYLLTMGKCVPMGGITDLNLRKNDKVNIVHSTMKYIVKYISDKNLILYGYTRLDMPLFYRSLGIESLMRYYELVKLPREIPMKPYEVIRTYKHKEFTLLKEIYEKDIFEKGIGIYRSKQYWESYILPQIKYACLYEKNGMTVGYMICKEIDKLENGKLYWSVDEFHEICGSNCFNNLLVGMKNMHHLPSTVKIPKQYADKGGYNKLQSLNNIKLKWKSDSVIMKKNISKLQKEVWIWELDNF